MKKLIKRLIYRLRANYITEDLEKMGLKVGKNFKRMHDVILDPSHCWLISIGNDVTIAPRAHILAHDASLCHHLGYARIGKVIIGNNVFIGADTVILPNVTIGDNCIIGANSTVSRNIPSGVVAAGSPAKVICSLDEYIAKNKEMMRNRPKYNEEFTLRENISEEKKKKMIIELQDGFGFVK
jgi:maltose O-acetyltransferase